MDSDLGSLTGMFTNFDYRVILDKLYMFLGLLLLAAILGGVLFLIYKVKKQNKDVKNIKKIGWWEEIHGEMSPNDMDDAIEITAPGTALKFFYIKKKDMWLPRFTMGITKNLFYVTFTPNRQLVNFKLKSLSADLKEVGIEYDHTDMLMAAENMREFVKRNYKDKSIKWWQAYKDVISTVIHIFIHTFSLAIIIYMLRGFVGDLSTVADTLNTALKASCNLGSGVVPA